METIDILMVGVGGQGTVLSSDIVCDVALLSGKDVKKSEIHGMAQRGGSVTSHVRIGDKIFSPVMPAEGADILLSFEKMEYLRYFEFVGKDTTLVISSQNIFPPSVADGREKYPYEVTQKHLDKFKKVDEIDALVEAKKLGNSKVAGMVMLGVLAKYLPFEKSTWQQVIKDRVPPKTVELNLKAFDVGNDS